MHLGNVNMLLLLWLAPAMALLYAWAAYRRRTALARFIEAGLLGRISLSVNPGARRLKAALLIAAAVLMIAALARPAWNPKPRKVERRGRDIMFVLDVSRSMLAEDLAPNRLERSKYAISDMVARLEGDRVGLIVFAGTAALKCPLTLDYGFFSLMLDDVDINSIARGGTMIGDAIRKSLDEGFDDQEKKYKDLILITDGEDHDSFPVEAAEEAGRRGIRIIAIGIGDDQQGRRIPVTDERGSRVFLTYNGQEVWSRLDAATLRKMASATPGGRYLNVATGTIDLGDVYSKLIAGEEKREIESLTVKLYEEKYQIFLAAALAVLLIEMVLSERRKRPSVRAAAALILVFLAAARPSPASAESSGGLVSKGNGKYHRGEYQEAAALYEKASVKTPESPVVAFNLGAVSYRLGDFSGARGHFEDAAMKTRDLDLEAKAWYNIGNCAFSEGARQADSDLEKALKSYEESVGFYATALEKNPALSDAAHNMEIARLAIKDLLDKMQRQKEEMQKQQEQIQQVVDSLAATMRRQGEALERSKELDADPGKGSRGWGDGVKGLDERQEGINRSTSGVRDRLDGLFPQEKPDPVRQALSNLDTAMVSQDDASKKLEASDPGGAAPGQEEALDQMRKALEKLAQGKDQQQPQGQEGGDQQQNGQQPQDKQQPQQEDQQGATSASRTARDILEEERENRKNRREAGSSGYKKVDKDW